MGVKTIKGIDDPTWRQLKSYASNEDKSMAEMIKKLVESYDKQTDEAWKIILSGEKIISEKEAIEMKKRSYAFRKSFNWRT